MISFLFRRLLAILATLFVVTVILYSLAMLSPVEERAMLYFPNTNSHLTEQQTQRIIQLIIKQYGLDQPFPVQYANWVIRLVRGDWGYSPTANSNVLDALLVRTPTSFELIVYSLVLFIPLGIVSGLIAGGGPGKRFDKGFRTAAFIGAAIPPFILALVLLAIFWVGLYWFPIGHLGTYSSKIVNSPTFHMYTGLVTIDGLLNRHPEVSVDALRRLVLPVITLSLAHWATLGRITRATTIDEMSKEYILAARGRGVTQKDVLWHHALHNVLVPGLNSSALSAASLVTGLFIVEVIFLYNGLSSLFTGAFRTTPDIAAAMGFAIYSVLAVLIVMTVLDILQAFVDPRIRAGVLS